MLGEPVLIGRDAAGTGFALRDICPHRGMPLNAGRFDGREIECCYRGWRFDTAGRCTGIPALVPGQPFAPDRVRVRRYPVREVQGNIWVYFGDDDPAGAPGIPEIEGFEDRAAARRKRALCCGDRPCRRRADGPGARSLCAPCVVVAFTESIHAKAKAFAPSPWGFTMTRHRPSTNSRGYRLIGGVPETEIVFRLPGVRIEETAPVATPCAT